MDARPRRYCCVVLHRLTSEEIRRHSGKKTNTSKTPKSSPQNKNKTYKYSTPTRWRPKMTMPSRVNKNNIAEHSAHSTKYHSSTAVMRSYVNKNETAEDSAGISKQQNLKMATQTYVNKYKTGEDSARISKQQNSKMATQSYVNKYKTGEDSASINKQQDSGKAISRCVIDRTTEDNVPIAPKAILKRRKSDSIVETRQNSTKQDNNCDNQRTSKKQRIKNDYFVKTYNNIDENIIVPSRKRKSDSEFEAQSTLRSISNKPFEILPKKRRQEFSVCDNTENSITNTKVTTASKFIKFQNSNFYSQLSCNQSTASKNKHTEKETVNGEKANVTIIDNSEILQTERVETYSEMQKNQRQSSKNLEIDNEDIVVVYDNFYTEDRKLNGPSQDINILNGNPECSPTYRPEINNASRKNSHKVENSRKLLNSTPVYNPNKRYFKMYTAAYENSLKKSPLFQIKNLYRMAHISELDLSSSFGYGNQFSSHLTNKINNNIRLPIDTSEYRFDTVCDLNESFLFNLIAAEDIDKLKLGNLQNIECVIYYSCKVNKILSSVTQTNFAGRIILTGDTKQNLIKYPADLKDKYSLNTNTRDFPHLKRRSIDEDVADTISPSNETDVYFTLREMIQGISKKYEKQKHWYHCKCCHSPFSTYNELEPICPTCNIYCTLDFHLKHFDSKGFSKISQRRSFISHKIKHIYTNNATNIPKLDKKDLVKELSQKNISASKDSAKILTSVEEALIHETPVNLETFENLSVTNPINNTCFHLMNGSPVTGRQESQQELLVENTDEGENVNASAELIMLDTSEGYGEHETYLLFAVENDAMPEQKSKDLQVVENLESEITDEKDGCEEQDDAILLKSTKNIQLENAMLPSLDAEPQGQDDDDSNIQFILLHDSNSGEISPTVEVTVADDEQNLSKNNSVPSCTAQSIDTTSISEPDSSEIQIIEYTSICQSSTDTPNLPLTTSDVSKDLFQNSVVPTCISNPNSPAIQIIEDAPIKSSSDAYNPKLHSSTIDEPEENLSEKSPIPACISQAENPEIQIIEDTPIKSSSEAYNPKLHSTTIDEPEKNLSKKSPIPTRISLPEIQIIEESSVCLSPNDTSNPKLPSDTIDRTEKTLTENSSKPSSISQSDSSGIRIIACTSISQSVDMPNLPSTTTDVSDDLSENSLLPTDISHCFALKIQIIEYNSVCQFSDAQDPKLLTTDESVLKIPVVIDSIEMPSNMEDNVVNNEGHLSKNSLEPICNSHTVSPKIQILEYNSLCQSDLKLLSNLTEESEENLSENSQMTTRISQSDTPKIQILNYNSICKSSRDIQDPKLPSAKSPNPTVDDSNLNIPVIQSVKSLADTINSTNELLWNSGISDKVIFSRTLPTSSVTETSINSIEEATLEEEVQRKAAENANSTLERDFCDISDTKDHSESNLIPGRDNYINGCNSESSLRLSTERESTEHDIESNSISHEFLNSQSSKNSPTKKAKKDDDDFTPTLPIVNVSPMNSKEEVPLEEKVERENEENSNYTHVRNVCELSDTKDHSESNITSDIASYMNECHSENSSQVNMDAGESTERNTPKSNSFSPEFLNSQNSNNLSLKTEREGGDYTHTLPPANVNESFISCTEEIPLEEVVQRKTAKNSNCAVERDFSGTKDHSESDFISEGDSYLNDCNSEKVSIDIEESATQIPEINSLSREFLNSQKGKKDEDHYTPTVQTASVNDSPIFSSKDVSVEEHVLRQTAENSKFSLERDFCDVSDTKDHSEYNFTSDKGSYMNDCNSENSLQVSRDTGESTEHDVPEVNSMSHELLNSPISNDLPLKKTTKDNDVSDSSVSSTEELPLEEMQRKNSKNSNYAPERNFCDFGDVKNHNESNSSSNFVYFEEDFSTVFLKYVRVLEDLLPQEIISVKNSNADGSENAYLTLDMLGIASTIASLDILNDYSKVSKFIDFVSKCIYYLENDENRDESKILKTKYFLKQLYVINDFIKRYGTYDKLVEALLKNGGKISAWDCNRGAAKDGSRVRYSNIDPKLSKMKSFLVTKGDSSTKGTTSNICDTYLELLNNPALLADVNQQTSSKYRNPHDKCCALTNCKECNIYSDRNEDKLETIVIASEVYDESNAHMSSEPKNSNSHESGTLLYNRGLRLEKCIKKIKNMNEPLSSDVSQDCELRTSPSPSKIITYDSISPISRTVSENLVTADSSQLNNTSCLLDYSRVVEALTTDKNSEVSQNRLSPESLLNEVLKGKRPYRKRSDKVIKEKRTYKKRNVKPTQEQLPILTSPISSLSQSIDTPVTTHEQLPILTSPISSLSQSIDTPVVGFKPKENAPLIPLCNQNESLKVSQEQQPASANPSIPLCNLNSSLHMDQGQQYPLANLSAPLCNQSVILIDQEQPLNLCQTSGNMHYNCKTNPHFDYRMPSYSSPSQVPWHTPITQSSSVQGVPHITGASFTSDALVQKNVRQTDSSSSSHCSVQTSVTTRTDISVETLYAPSLRHLANFVSGSRTSNTSRGEFSNSEKNIQNTRTFTGSRAVPYPPQCMPRYPETFSLLPPLYSSQTLSSTSQPSSQYMYPGHHPYPCQCYSSMPHPPSFYMQSSYSSSQSTPIIPPSYSSSQSTPTISPSSYTQSSCSSSQSTPIIPPSSYRQSSHSSSQSTPIIPPSSYRQSSHSSSQSTPIIPPSSYTQSSYSSPQSTPTIPSSSYTQSSYSSSQSTPIIPPSFYTQSLYSSSQSTPISPASSYMQSSNSAFQPSFQRTPYPSPRMQQSSSDPRTLPHLHQMNLPYIHSKYK